MVRRGCAGSVRGDFAVGARRLAGWCKEAAVGSVQGDFAVGAKGCDPSDAGGLRLSSSHLPSGCGGTKLLDKSGARDIDVNA